MIVVDTNIVIYLFLPTQYTPLSEKLLLEDSHWIAPILWKSEFRNVLALYIRKKILSQQNALIIQQEAEDLFFENEYQVSSVQVLRLVASSECSAYDCEFVALAQNYDIPLITQDKKILRNFPNSAFSLDSYLNSKV